MWFLSRRQSMIRAFVPHIACSSFRYPSDLALEAADATAPLADFSHYDAATAIAARSASAAMTTPLLFSPFGSGSSFAPWDGGGADDATLVAHVSLNVFLRSGIAFGAKMSTV